MINFATSSAVLSACVHLGFCLSASNVKIEQNGYTGIVIAINPDIPEDEALIEAIKETWTDASRDLYIATKNVAYFKEITILLPKTWDNKIRDPVTGNQNYDQADVIVALPNPSYGNEPYTLQHGGCGEHGIRSHYTPEFLLSEESLTNYGPRGKVVVHEWAHYRWGVFDETSDENPFYWDPNNDGSNGPEATRCPVTLYGEVRDIESEDAIRRCSLIDIDSTTNSYPSNCVFLPFEDQFYHPNTSMMCYQYMDEVTTFCHDGVEGGGADYNIHNIYAPNDQNRLCKMKSTWTVIMESPDFSNDTMDFNFRTKNTTPSFKIVRPGDQRFVLILDVSGSMQGWKLEALRQTAYKFITVFSPDGSWVGMVQFSSSAQTLSNLKQLNSAKDREDLASLLPNYANGGTCIGCGIAGGIAVLEDFGNPAGGRLIVITDGAGSGVENVYDEVLNKGIVMDTVYIETNANEILTQLTEESGGNWYYTDDGTNLDEIFSEISSSDSTESNAYQILAETFELSDGENHESFVYIDFTIGLDTAFVFTWSVGSNPPTIYIQGPSGCSYTNYHTPSVTLCPGGSIYNVTLDFRTIKFVIPGIAEVGKWIYSITTSTSTTSTTLQTISTVVTSLASDSTVPPIVIESGMSVTDVSEGTATVVYAKVTQGYNPILGANVVATINRPYANPVVTNLYDNGAGADIRVNDGIYSRYFTEYSGSGRYSVEVQVGHQNSTGGPTTKISRASRANYRPGLISTDGSAKVNENGAISPEGNESASGGIQSEDMGEFSRVVSSGGFSYSGPAVTVDTFPPGQIIDASLQQSDLEDFEKGVILEFTAPGDDLDSGTASAYELRYTYDDPTILERSFSSCEKIAQDDLILGNLSGPLSAGSVETFITHTPKLPSDKEYVRLAFAIRAIDSAGNKGDPSNIATINFFVEPLVIPTILPTTEPDPTTTKSKITKPKITKPKTTTSEPSLVVCPDCEECDPLYMILMISFVVSTGIFITSTLILSIWLCKANKQLKQKETQQTCLHGVDNWYEPCEPLSVRRTNKIVPFIPAVVPDVRPVMYRDPRGVRRDTFIPRADADNFEY